MHNELVNVVEVHCAGHAFVHAFERNHSRGFAQGDPLLFVESQLTEASVIHMN